MTERIESTIGNLLHRVPGYSGYRSKEDRRDDDRRLREAVASRLDTVLQNLTRVSASLAQRRDLGNISAIERHVSTTRLLADRVRTASYGYGGIFTDQSIDEFVLEQLRLFDASFQAEVETLATIASRLASSTESLNMNDVSAYQDELNRLGLLFDARGAVVETARPNRDSAVLALLAPSEKSAHSQITALVRGDALSLAGDNLLVDATVTLAESGGVLHLARIGSGTDGGDKWLMGSSVEGVAPARLTEVAHQGLAPQGGRPAEVVIDAAGGAGPSVAARYLYTSGTGDGASLWYAIGDEVRSFQGETINESDVVIYGQA